MRLRPDPIVLVLERRVLEIAERLFRRLHRAREHEAQRVKHPHARLAQLALGCEPNRLADIPQQHVGALHLGQCSSIRARDRLFEEALLQADPQIAGHDLHQVLRLQPRGSVEQLADQRAFCRRSPRRRDPPEGRLHLDHAQRRLTRAPRQHFSGHRSQVSMPPIRRREFFLALSRELTHCLPQKPPADLQGSLFPRRKRLAREKHRRDRRLLHRARLQILRDDPGLHEFLSSSRDRLAGLGKSPHISWERPTPAVQAERSWAFSLHIPTCRALSQTKIITYPFSRSPMPPPCDTLSLATLSPEASSNQYESPAQHVPFSGGPAAPAGARER